MFEIKGQTLATIGISLATIKPAISYQTLDCQAFIEKIFEDSGMKISYAGSNDMFRNACVWIGTIDEAKKKGYLKPGVALFILEFDGNEPSKYRADGMGNASHVGMYVGEDALKDYDKKGNERVCNVVHSSASMGRVAGSSLKNGWTHVGLWKNVDFGFMANGDDEEVPETNKGTKYARIETENLKPVNFRTKMNVKSALVPRMPEIPLNAIVEVKQYIGDWANVVYKGYTGYVKSEFLAEDLETVVVTEDKTFVDETVGNIDEKAKRYRVYIDFLSKKEALAFQTALLGCQIGSVK